MRTIFLIIQALIIFVLMVATSFGGVNLKNGNFYISYTDLVVPGGGKQLEITRTYNSKSADIGWFGVGWGSEFETFLKVSADGSVVVHEHGAGARNRFVPKTKIEPTQAASKIIEAMRKRTTLTQKVAQEMKKKLASNAELRHVYSRRYKINTNLAKGTLLFSHDLGSQKLKVTNVGYERIYNSGRVEHFDKEGKLVKVKDKTGYSINLKYNDKTDRLVSIKDSQAKQIFFDWYADGRVKSLWSVGDKKAHYKYKGNDLIESKDVGDHLYKYKYDSNHNLVAINYEDGSSLKLDYGNKTQFVTKVIDRNGEVTKYKYESNPQNPDKHYWTLVTKKGLDGKPVTNRYEYEIKTREDGSHYTYRILTVVNGLRTETIYSEKGSLPLKIVRGDNVTNFEYNDDGLLIKKSSPSSGNFVKIDYEKKFNKIAKVEKKNGWTKFNYDKRGNLQRAEDSNGKAVLLLYDSKGRITKMVDKNIKKKLKPRTLSFTYNALGKPVEISLKGGGKIKVEYDNFGQIKKVDSKSGPKMAVQVSQAFKNLLKVVQPAGVDLKMF